MADVRAVFGLGGPDLPIDRIVVGTELFTIGRVPGNSLMLPHARVSRHHADITFHDGQFYIEDLESSNGTIVGGERIEAKQPRLIKPGDSIQFGPFTLNFERIESTDAALPSPTVSAEPSNTVDLNVVSADGSSSSVPPVPNASIGTPINTPVDVPNAIPPAVAEKPPQAAISPRKPDDEVPELPAEPAVYISQVPAAASEAVTSPPQHTLAVETPLAPAPAASPAVSGAENGVVISDTQELLEPTYKPSRNGHAVLAPYEHIEGVSLPEKGSQYIGYLPGMFSDSDFLKRYLLIMESILEPLDWGVDSLEQYYNPLVTTPDWLQWIGEWFDVLIHPSLSITRQRAVVKELGLLFRQRGTKRGMIRLLELYFGVTPQIDELESPPATFKVTLPLGTEDTPLARALAIRLITTCKPAYTGFTLEVI